MGRPARDPLNTGSILAKQPMGWWNKRIEFDLEKAVRSIVSAGLAKAIQDPGLAAKAIDDAVGTLRFREDPEETIWILIHRATIRAVGDLLLEHISGLTVKQSDIERLSKRFRDLLEKQDLVVTKKLFSKPKCEPFIPAIVESVQLWIPELGAKDSEASTIAQRLPSYFVYAFHREWRANRKAYDSVLSLFVSPFEEAVDKELQWSQYSSWLNRQIDEPLFGEPFGLRQIYVPLRAFYITEHHEGQELNQNMLDEFAIQRKKKRIAVRLESALAEWLNTASKSDAIRVVSGGPGSGKSSFAKVWAASLADAGHRVLFVPLHHLDISSEFPRTLNQFMRASGFFSMDALEETPGERLILILDGLDELAMQGKIAEQTAKDFVDEVQRVVAIRNQQELTLQVIMTGRELTVQSTSALFRKPEQVLHVLPYLVSEEERGAITDPNSLLKEDQRNRWWRNYSALTGKSVDALPKDLKGRELDEVTAQPLLNYLVALTYFRGKVDFKKETNLNVIYLDLLNAVYERGWADHPHPALSGVTRESFIRILEEIGVAARHGNGRTTTVADIEMHCASIGLKQLLEAFQDGARAGVTRLLTAFYFRQSGQRQDGERTFEFTHKSFGEYLTARRIIRAASRMHTQMTKRGEDIEDGWDHREALVHWSQLTGPFEMDSYLLDFVVREVALRQKEEVAAWQASLSALFSEALTAGAPVDRTKPGLPLRELMRQARNAEESLLAVLNACARHTTSMTRIRWPNEESFGAWVRRVQGQRNGPKNVVALQCLSYLDMSQCCFDIADLYAANLSCSDLRSARFHFACLIEADLQNSDLRGAILTGASLRGAKIAGCNVQEALLGGTMVGGLSDPYPRKRVLQALKRLGAIVGPEYDEPDDIDAVTPTSQKGGTVRKRARPREPAGPTPARKGSTK